MTCACGAEIHPAYENDGRCEDCTADSFWRWCGPADRPIVNELLLIDAFDAEPINETNYDTPSGGAS
jgi:hypothetical protein